MPVAKNLFGGRGGRVFWLLLWQTLWVSKSRAVSKSYLYRGWYGILPMPSPKYRRLSFTNKLAAEWRAITCKRHISNRSVTSGSVLGERVNESALEPCAVGLNQATWNSETVSRTSNNSSTGLKFKSEWYFNTLDMCEYISFDLLCSTMTSDRLSFASGEINKN